MIWHGMACQATYTYNVLHLLRSMYIRSDTSKHEHTYQKNEIIIQNERRQQYEKWKKFIGVAICIKMHKNILINIDKKKIMHTTYFLIQFPFFVFYAKFEIIRGIKKQFLNKYTLYGAYTTSAECTILVVRHILFQHSHPASSSFSLV